MKKITSTEKFTLLAVVVIALVSIALTPITLQNDTFYTIKIGESILQNGIDMQDHFSWHENLPYTYPHWAYDLITYLIYSVFDMKGIYVLTCILSVILGITIYYTNKKIAKNQIFSLFITVGSMYLIRQYIAARAQLVTFTLFMLTILMIEQFLETKKKRYAVGLIIIPILIANLHAAVFPFYFVLYLPYIVEYLLACLAEILIYKKIEILGLKVKIKILSKKEKNAEKVKNLEKKLNDVEEKVDRIKIKRAKELENPYKIKLVKNNNVKWLIVIFIICMFTGLLTPIGDTPYTYLIKTMQGTTTKNINEHTPMTLSQETEIMCTLILFLSILIFTKAKIKLRDLFMLGGLCYLMLYTKRQSTMFVLICSVILNKLIMEIISIYYKDIELKNIVKAFTSIVGALLTIFVTLFVSYYLIKDKLNDSYINKYSYPVEACDYILENIDLSKARFYNEYNYGSYMLYRGIPVFIDSRADLYAPEFNKKDDIFMEFIDTSSIGQFYEDLMEKYDITHLILYKDSKIQMIISKTEDKNYKELYSDQSFVVYERIKE